MTPEEMARFQKACNGCQAFDDQLERVRKTEAMLVAERQAQQETRERLKVVRAIAAALVKEPTVKQVGEQLFRALDGGLLLGRIGGVDIAVAPDVSAQQNWLTFSCPAGCDHKVLIPVGATATEAGTAITSSTGLAYWRTAEGALCWDRHEAVAAGSIEILEPVRTLEEYSSDIEDPLRTAHEELDCAILGVDSEKAWALTNNSDRDLWVSSVEMFMAAMLKWAQQEERRRHHAAGVLLREHNEIRRGDPLAAVLKVLTGLEPDQQETEMKDKTLHNSNVNGAKKNVSDLKVYGNGDLFKLLTKASSEEEGWMKSTKVMQVGGQTVSSADSPFTGIPQALGCLVQVTTQQRNADGSYAVAEALTFVPGATMADFDFPPESK